MRSSKSRSRNKQRNRSVGNIVNRVFDSSGPEGKVRGTPQQIIDKYNQLARDSQLSGDRVATENFQQHAEHYTRMLAEAQREQNERREQQEQQQRDRQQQRGDHQQRDESGGSSGNQNGQQQPQQALPDQGQAPQPDVVDAPSQFDAGTQQPEEGSAKRSRSSGSRKKSSESNGAAPNDVIDLADTSDDDGETGLVETPEEKPKRKPRAPRKPKAKAADEASSTPQGDAPSGDAAAAE